MGEERSMNCMRNRFSECNKDKKISRDVLVVFAFFLLCFFDFTDRLPCFFVALEMCLFCA